MFFAIIAISYILAINVFGFRIVKIQRSDRLKNGEPTPQIVPIKQLECDKKATGTDISKEENVEVSEKSAVEVVSSGKKSDKKAETLEKSKSRNSKKTTEPSKPHNGDKMKKDALLSEEKLNFKRYERIPDLKIMLVALFGGALGEFVAFLVFKYRTTNTILMVVLPVLISLWGYLVYILTSGIFIV